MQQPPRSQSPSGSFTKESKVEDEYSQSREAPPQSPPYPQNSGSPPPPQAANGYAGAPLPQNAVHAFPQYQSQMQNAGTAVGGMVGVMGGGAAGSVGGDMLMGGVVGGMVGQRLAQAENHAFWRDQALQYREGRAAGVIPPPEVTADGKKASWWSREGRAQRRAERWERRAKRRDGA